MDKILLNAVHRHFHVKEDPFNFRNWILSRQQLFLLLVFVRQFVFNENADERNGG